MKRILILSLVTLGLTCNSAKPPPLDLVLLAGQARAGKVTKTTELIGGPVAFGRVGDVWKLYNSKVRFLIQDVGTAVGLSLYGGNLIDADLVRPGDDGQNGNDLFRETFPIVGLHVPDGRSIEVLSDGQVGGAAKLRVHSKDVSSMIIPQLDELAQDLGGDITVDYELLPDVPYLKITTTYQTRPGQSLDSLLLGDFLAFGGSLTILSPENGFTGSASTVSFLAGVGDGTSYGYVYEEGPVQVPIVDASGTATLLGTPTVPKDSSVSAVRYMVIGDGDAASLMGSMYALRKIGTTPLDGTVKDAAGAPVDAARVLLFRAPYSATSRPMDQAKTHADGRYHFDAPAGTYVAMAFGSGRLRGAPTPLTSAGGDLAVGDSGRVELDIGEMVGGSRIAAPAKVSLFGVGVEAPEARFGPEQTETERNGVWAVALSPDGHGTLPVKPGTYDVVVSRGVEYELEKSQIVVPPGSAATVTATLRRVVDTTGWLSGDYHQHSQGSIDSPVPIGQRVAEDLAEGIEFPAGTDHDNIIDFRPYIAELHAEAWINAVPGDEISVNGVGHFNAYPLTVDPADPYAKVGTKLWAGVFVDEWIARLRELEPDPIVVHVSHPRTKALAGYFNTIHWDPTTGMGTANLDSFDAVEVNGEIGVASDFVVGNDSKIHDLSQTNQSGTIPTMRDWFGLLNQGKTICALGNSDTHQRNGGTGYPRNFVGFGFDDPRQATGKGLVDAMHAQRVLVSNGPFVTTTINGMSASGRSAVASVGATAALGVKIQAPSWIGVSSLEVYFNGRPVPLTKSAAGTFVEDLAGSLSSVIDIGDSKSTVVRLDGVVTVKPTVDGWYVVVVRGPGTLAPVDGSVPYAYTNPIYVDVGGDGWTAPGL